jgi:hypothetical protein
MKTTLDIPGDVFRQAKARSAECGVPLRQFVTEAMQEKLHKAEDPGDRQRRWLELFGSLRDLRPETRRIAALIEYEFERIDPEDGE